MGNNLAKMLSKNGKKIFLDIRNVINQLQRSSVYDKSGIPSESQTGIYKTWPIF